MKLTLALALSVIAYGPCSREAPPPRASAAAPAPARPPAPPAPALAAPARPVSVLPAGVWPGADALAVTVADPPTIIVRRAGASASFRLTAVSCALAGEPGARGFGPATTCTWAAERCRGTLRAERMVAIGGSGTKLVVETETPTGEQGADCATLAGTFEERHGGPVPPRIPPVPDAACLTAAMKFSRGGAACLTAVDARTLQSYVGACCVGRPARRFAVDDAAAMHWLSPDGLTVVGAVRGLTVSVDDLRDNAPVLRVYREGAPRVLRVRDLLAGDPVLAQGVGFSIDVRVDDAALTVGPIGGASHALPLAP